MIFNFGTTTGFWYIIRFENIWITMLGSASVSTLTDAQYAGSTARAHTQLRSEYRVQFSGGFQHFKEKRHNYFCEHVNFLPGC